LRLKFPEYAFLTLIEFPEDAAELKLTPPVVV
jgi:hypothetical protein